MVLLTNDVSVRMEGSGIQGIGINLTKVVDVLDAGHIREVRCLKKNVVNLE
jgi:hypothetical protein